MEDLKRKIEQLEEERERVLYRLEEIDANIAEIKVMMGTAEKSAEEKQKEEKRKRKEAVDSEVKKRMKVEEGEESKVTERKEDERAEMQDEKRREEDNEKEEVDASTSHADSAGSDKLLMDMNFSEPFLFIADLSYAFRHKEEKLNDAHTYLGKFFTNEWDNDKLVDEMERLFIYSEKVIDGLKKFLEDADAVTTSRKTFLAAMDLMKKVGEEYGTHSQRYILFKHLLNNNKGNYFGEFTLDETLNRLFEGKDTLKIAAIEYFTGSHDSDQQVSDFSDKK